jgi:hypothetical protein
MEYDLQDGGDIVKAKVSDPQVIVRSDKFPEGCWVEVHFSDDGGVIVDAWNKDGCVASEAIDLHEFMPDEAYERPSTPTSPAVDIPQSTRYPGDANVRSLDAIAARLTAGGIPDVIVEMTGGGVATLYAGPTREQEGWGKRYTLAAGPGWFEPHWSAPNARGFFRIGDGFYFGPDHDGDAHAEEILVGDEIAIADAFIQFIREQTRPEGT